MSIGETVPVNIILILFDLTKVQRMMSYLEFIESTGTMLASLMKIEIILNIFNPCNFFGSFCAHIQLKSG